MNAGDVLSGCVTCVANNNGGGNNIEDISDTDDGDSNVKNGPSKEGWKGLVGIPITYTVSQSCVGADVKEKETAKGGKDKDNKAATAAAPDEKKKEESNETATEKDTDAEADTELTNAVRDAQYKILLTRKGKSTFQALFDSMCTQYPKYLPIRCAQLAHVCMLHRDACTAAAATPAANGNNNADKITTATDAVLDVCTALLDHVNPKSVAGELGMLAPDKSDEAALTARTDAESGKSAIIDALAVRCNLAVWKWQILATSAAGIARGSAAATVSTAGSAEELLSAVASVETCVKALQRWSDVNSDKHWYIHVMQSMMKGNYGIALKKISSILDKADKGDKIPTDDYSIGTRGSSTTGMCIYIYVISETALYYLLCWECRTFKDYISDS
jgi:hypothetical protein